MAYLWGVFLVEMMNMRVFISLRCSGRGRGRRQGALCFDGFSLGGMVMLDEYRGTSLTRKRTPLGPYSSPMPLGTYGDPRGVGVSHE